MSKWNEGYAAGHKAAWERRDATDHLIAFGAIRRAAEVARQHEQEAKVIGCGSTDFQHQLAAEHVCLARAVRRVIRAAIGSDKA